MRIKKWQIASWIIMIGLMGFGLKVFQSRYISSREETKIIHPSIGDIITTVSSTGTVLPRNRLEVKAPVNGRIEKVLVREGQKVTAGETILLMSSMERAALLDASRGQGEDKLKYWQEVYKPIPLIAPITGDVIVGTIQPGQTVTTADAVIVLSDYLIIRAQIDETDIGKIHEGRDATLSLDAYPETQIKATVDHIYYESKTVNNVTIYQVDLLPERVPLFFRSGMTANVEIIQEIRHHVLRLPIEAIHHQKDSVFVLVKLRGESEPVMRPIETGLSNEKFIEVIGGLIETDEIVISKTSSGMPKRNVVGNNPFMPMGQRKRQ